MNCPNEDDVSQFVAGALPDDDREQLTSHLSRCTDCRELVSELARDLDAARTFAAGELVAARYRIRRLVGDGGMGEVYEADDVELRTQVALKTIRADIAADPKVLELFKREIFLARKVTHVNVCRIFDMGFHAVGDRRIAFLTMELLDGETLADRIARGRLAATDALPIAQQIIAGLAAAHHEGVVHRDLKSANVMLVRRGDSLWRVVLTDFGLARGAAGDANSSVTTAHRGLVGSPAYMAPEQVAGLAVTAAADVYALGVVLFEMVTGAWPFVDRTPELTAFKRLQEPAPSARDRVPELDVRWDAAIARCLERAPEARFERVDDVATALTGARPRKRRRWKTAAIAAGLASLGVVALAVSASPAAAPPSLSAPSVSLPSPPKPTPAPRPPIARTASVAAPPQVKTAKPRTPARAVVQPADPKLDHFILTYPQ